MSETIHEVQKLKADALALTAAAAQSYADILAAMEAIAELYERIMGVE